MLANSLMSSPEGGLSVTGRLERRRSSRIHAVCFPAKVMREGDVGLFRVQNLSDTGLMLVAHVDFEVGEHVSITLLDGVSVDGRVVWTEGCCRGIEFDRPIDCANILHTLAEERKRQGVRALRMPVTRLATLYAEVGIRAVKVTNVSRAGVGFQHDGSLCPGMAVKLILESGAECCGTVRWSANGQAGIQLSEPWNCEELESARAL